MLLAQIQFIRLEDGVGIRLPLVAAVAAAGAIAALVLRGRGAAGAAYGLFVGAISGAVLLVLAADKFGDARTLTLTHTFSSLALLWSAARAVGLQSTAAGRVRDRVFALAAAVCGLAACGLLSLSWRHATRISPEAVTIDAAVLLAAVLAAWGIQRTRATASTYPIGAEAAGMQWLAYAAAAIAALPLAAWLHSGPTAPPAPFPSWGLLLMTAGALATVIATVLIHWRRRSRAWMRNPQQLLEKPPQNRTIHWIIAMVCVTAGLGAFRHSQSWPAALALALAALTMLCAGHLQARRLFSELGLVLLACGVVVTARATLNGLAGTICGLAAAGTWMWWLSAFWRQQVSENGPWTTAGRMIPATLRVGLICAAGCFAAAVAGGAQPPHDAAIAGSAILFVLVMFFGYCGFRVGKLYDLSSVTAAGGLLCFAAVATAVMLGSPLGALPSVVLGVGVAAFLSAVVFKRRGEPKRHRWVVDALIAGIAPVALGYLFAVDAGVQPLVWIGAVAAIVAANVLHAWPARVSPAGSGN